MVIKTLFSTYYNHGAKAGLALLHYYFHKLRALYSGPGRECTVCGWTGPEFYPVFFPTYAVVRKKVMCPTCGSYERHRAYCIYYKNFFASDENMHLKEMVHFAPEESLFPLFLSFTTSYVRSNYENARAGELSLDLRNLDLPDESFNLLVMNHTLCCVPGDDQAVRSMYRVLRANGVVLAGEAVAPDRGTIEFPEPQYGGILRSYGMLDLEERFAPFTVQVIDASAGLSQGQRTLFGINDNEMVIVLRKSP